MHEAIEHARSLEGCHEADEEDGEDRRAQAAREAVDDQPLRREGRTVEVDDGRWRDEPEAEAEQRRGEDAEEQPLDQVPFPEEQDDDERRDGEHGQAARGERAMVVSEIGEMESPNVAPARMAPMSTPGLAPTAPPAG